MNIIEQTEAFSDWLGSLKDFRGKAESWPGSKPPRLAILVITNRLATA